MIKFDVTIELSKDPLLKKGKIKTQSGPVKFLSFWLKKWRFSVSEGDRPGSKRECETSNKDKYGTAAAHLVRGMLNMAANILGGAKPESYSAGDIVEQLRDRRKIDKKNGPNWEDLDYLFPTVYLVGDLETGTLRIDAAEKSKEISSAYLLFDVWQEQVNGSIDKGFHLIGLKDPRFKLSIAVRLDGQECGLDEVTEMMDDYRKLHPNTAKVVTTLASVPAAASYIEVSSATSPSAITGRQWVFDAIDRFIDKRCVNPVERFGCVCVMGPPGIGKSAISEAYAGKNSLPHIPIKAWRTTKKSFLERMHSEIVRVFGSAVGPPAETDFEGPAYLTGLFAKLSANLGVHGCARLIIDGIDEGPEGLLDLIPDKLPNGIFLICTLRGSVESDCVMLERFPATKVILILPDDENHQQDVRSFLDELKEDEDIVAFSKAIKSSPRKFLDTLFVRSEKNFMYLYYVIFDIRNNKGRYKNLGDFPVGLEGYYKAHVVHLEACSRRGLDWKKLVLPIIIVLRESASGLGLEDITLLASAPLVGELEESDVADVLNEIGQFLIQEQQLVDLQSEAFYRIYHTDFRQYLKYRAVLPNGKKIGEAVMNHMGRCQTDEFTNPDAPEP